MLHSSPDGILTYARRLLLLAGCCLATTSVLSQIRQTTFQTLQINGATPYHSSYALSLDPFGFLWIGTAEGLLKYDGTSLESYQHIIGDTLSLPSNLVFNLQSDSKGNIYVQCAGEPLYLMYRRTRQFYRVTSETESSALGRVIAMAAGSDGRTWLATSSGLCSCEIQDDDDKPKFVIRCNWPEKHPLRALDGQILTTLSFDDSERLWVGTAQGLHQFNLSDPVGVNRVFPDSDIYVRDVFMGLDSSMYILTNGAQRLWKWNPELQKTDTIAGLHTIEDHSYLCGASDGSGTIWVSELGFGVHAVKADGEHMFYSPDKGNTTTLRDKYLRRPVTDYAGNIWWPGEVVYRLAAQHKTVYAWQETFRNLATVTAVYREGQTLWLGTLGGGLIKYHLVNDQYEQFDKGSDLLRTLPDERVYTVKPKGPDTLVLLTRGHLIFFDKRRRTMTQYSIASGPVRSIVWDAQGAWLTRSSSGIYFLNYHTREKTLFLNGAEGSPVVAQSYYIHRDAHGILWLCTLGDGLVRYDPVSGAVKKYQKDPQNPSAISSNILHMLAVDRNGRWWIGTSEGLNIFNPETGEFDVLSTKDGLTGDLVQNVAVDSAGNIWVSAGSGMNVINPDTREVRSFGYGDGLTNQQYYPRSIYVDADGIVYIGGYSGLNFFYPDQVSTNTVAPKVWISGIERSTSFTYTTSVEQVHEIILKPSENYVNISFASTHFTNAGGNRFEYRLDGMDDQWVDIGADHNIRLTGMQPGDYVLEVRTYTGDGVMSELPARLKIVVLPQFYQTWWFYALLVAIIGAIIFSIARYRVQHLKAEAAYERKLAETEMKALRSQMNPHFLFNSLNSIKSYIASNEPRNATNYLTKFAQLMRHILNHSKEEYVSLADELKALELYIQLEHIRFNNKFSYELIIDPNLEASQIDIQPLIIQPFVENAIWHGLMHLNRPGKLVVRIKDHNTSILVEVEDNGVGRSHAGLMNSKTVEKTKSYGMQITRERLQSKYQENQSIEIQDLRDERQEPCGTLVKLLLPKHYLV